MFKSKAMFGRQKILLSYTDGFVFLAGAFFALFLVWILCSFSTLSNTLIISSQPDPPTQKDPTTFYDDPDVSYWLEQPIHNWDNKRKQWLLAHFTSLSGPRERILMVTGSQPDPCKHPSGDHLQLRLFKNKVDYCRIHGCDIFYNNVLLHQNMSGFWAKYAAIRAAMVAHPESEWIWWVDSDAVITDMDFTLPLEKYRNYSVVMHGWYKEIYEKRSWTGLNAGVFLIRNCQWSMDFIERWIRFGPQSPDYEKMGRVEKETFPDKTFLASDDQTAVAYLLLKEKEKWGDKIYLESEYYFQGYWIGIVGELESVRKKYDEVAQRVRRLRKKHAEKDGGSYRAQWVEYINGIMVSGGYSKEKSWRRPFITHFTGCEPCSGEHNEMYAWDDCWNGMVKALNFGDDQVLRSFGYFRPDLINSSLVQPLRF